MLKEKKGITLIALVITIIVLLILAGVALNAIAGENGILDKAKQAREQSEAAQDLEEMQLGLGGALIDKWTGNSSAYEDLLTEIVNSDMQIKGLTKIEYRQNDRKEYLIVKYKDSFYSTSFVTDWSNSKTAAEIASEMINNLTSVSSSELKEENEVFYTIQYIDDSCWDDSIVLEDSNIYRVLVTYNSKSYEYVEEYDETTRKLDRNINKI